VLDAAAAVTDPHRQRRLRERTESRQLDGSLNRLLAPGLEPAGRWRASASPATATRRSAAIPACPAARPGGAVLPDRGRVQSGTSFNTSAASRSAHELVNLTPTTVTGKQPAAHVPGRLDLDLPPVHPPDRHPAQRGERQLHRLPVQSARRPTAARLHHHHDPQRGADPAAHRGPHPQRPGAASGGYVARPDLGGSFFQPADENRSYQLGARVSWTPVPGITTTIEPRYRASNRLATSQTGAQVPSRENRNLTFAAGSI